MSASAAGELRQWLRLLGSSLDRARIAEILRGASGPGEVLDYSDSDLAARFGLAAPQISALRRQPAEKAISSQIAAMEKHRIELIPAGDPRFPENLFKMRFPPAAVFVKGRIEAFDTLAAGIVGPRAATPYGRNVARHLSREFASTLTIISGAALGIDSAAHESALDAGGRTLAVLGCGIDVEYPAGNSALRARIGAGEQGALVSIFPPGTPPHRHNFPERNYILAGLSLVVIVVEASKKSGALVTARAAADEGRAVYAVPGDITRPNSEGSNQLLRDGAAVCTGAPGVIADLEHTLHHELLALLERRGARPESEQPAAGKPGADNAIERLILAEIRHHPVSHDDLIERFVPARLTIGDLASALLALELNGAIEQQPGRIYAPKL